MNKPILPESKIIGDRDRIERDWSRRYLLELRSALKHVSRSQAGTKIALASQRQLKQLWEKGWQLGIGHGDRELQLLGMNRQTKFAKSISPISNPQAERAIDKRNSELATTVGQTEWARMQKLLKQNVAGDLGRRDLRDAIASILGGARFKLRAETISRTELATAYNLGRLQTFVDNRVPSVRRYCILDERTCPVCSDLNDRVVAIANVRSIFAPSHPRCRCTLSPALEVASNIYSSELVPLDFANGRVPDQTASGNNRTWQIADLLAAIIG